MSSKPRKDPGSRSAEAAKVKEQLGKVNAQLAQIAARGGNAGLPSDHNGVGSSTLQVTADVGFAHAGDKSQPPRGPGSKLAAMPGQEPPNARNTAAPPAGRLLELDGLHARWRVLLSIACTRVTRTCA